VILIPVSSSAIAFIGYEGGILAVQFHTGRRYDHPGVPYDVYVSLMQAESKGAFYSQHTRGKYR
jgi:hypothetical protein